MSTVYTPRTLAARWACSVRQVYALIETGKLEAFRLGVCRGIRIRAEAVESWERNGGNTTSDDTGSDNSTVKPLSAGKTKKASHLCGINRARVALVFPVILFDLTGEHFGGRPWRC